MQKIELYICWQIPPFISAFSGIITQEIVNLLLQVYTPIQQFFSMEYTSLIQTEAPMVVTAFRFMSNVFI